MAVLQSEVEQVQTEPWKHLEVAAEAKSKTGTTVCYCSMVAWTTVVLLDYVEG